jgi:peptide/nickel transport system permease protein
MFSRLIYGAQNTVGLAVAITALSFFIGGLLGIVAAIRGGWIDMVLSWIVDILMAIPQLIYAMLLLTILGTSTPVIVGVVALLDSTRVFRLARAVASNLVVLDFVEAVRLRGEGILWIARRELLPNMLAPLIAEFGIRFCFVFLFIAALSFLGIGIQPPIADWGSMIRDNATLITFGEITPVLPGLAIAILTVAVNFIVDWILVRSGGSRL